MRSSSKKRVGIQHTLLSPRPAFAWFSPGPRDGLAPNMWRWAEKLCVLIDRELRGFRLFSVTTKTADA
jgi:hypothetical protein